MIYSIYYMKPEWIRHGLIGIEPKLEELDQTHAYLREIDVPRKYQGSEALEYIFHHSQGEIWSPNGEATELLDSKGLRHTSMSVGDVIEENGRYWLVAMAGFKRLYLT